MTTTTLRDSRADGVTAAKKWIREGILQPQHFTNPGADQFGNDGGNVADAAWAAFPSFSRHFGQSETEYTLELEESADFEDSHWEAFLEGFETKANNLAKGRGWEVQS